MRTGTRWTILVKLPVAFSGGRRLNTEPDGGRDALDRARDVVLGKGVDREPDRLARAQMGQLRLLEVGVDMDAVQRHQGRQPRVGLDVGADLHGLVADNAVDRGADDGEGEVALGLGHGGAQLARDPLGLGLLRPQHVDVRPLALAERPRRCGSRPGSALDPRWPHPSATGW